jgi:hypothetical protein
MVAMMRTHKLRASTACRANALKMGHCAPAVMQTLLETRQCQNEALVRAVGGLPGIGGPGECGGVVSPLMVLALEDPQPAPAGEVPKSILLGQEYLRRFREVHGSVLCRDIGEHCMRCCYRAIVLSPPLFDQVAQDKASASESTSVVWARFSSALERARFHCAHWVLDDLRDVVEVTQEMRAAAAIFVGGIALSGSTCGTLAAGAMAMSAQVSGIERSRWRTLKMFATMLFSVERALRDPMNAFNPAIRISTSLARWFGKQFGSVRCSDLTHMDIASPDSVERFSAGPGLESCKERARQVAAKVRELLAEERQ